MVDKINVDNLSDEELVEITISNQENFLYLIKRYETKLIRYIRRISGINLEDAEDVIQEVFIKTYQNLNFFDKDLKFSSWIYRIAHNEVISNFRKKQARAKEINFDNDDFINNIVGDADISKDIDLAFLKENIGEILSKMDIKYREVLILKFLEEKDYREISDILKKPMGTVATLINRAKKQFRDVLKKSNIQL
ncbi:RNA polymerase sigma factor [Patescibacteria group bacterium]|nr:RNA polymerase sigma factor [Patescibacteria group bacterium]